MKDTIYLDPRQFQVLQARTPVIAVTYGEKGFYPIHTDRTPEELNGPGVTPEIQEAALMGSMFGWDTPGAKPASDFLLNRIIEPATYTRYNTAEQAMGKGPKSISDDDLCSDCSHCDYHPGELSTCELGWPVKVIESGYVLECDEFSGKDKT